MEDRISSPGKTGWVRLDPVPGHDGIYVMSMADDPTVPGTPLDKSTFMSDSTARVLMLEGEQATPNYGFLALRQVIEDVRPKRKVLCDRADLKFTQGTSNEKLAVQLSDNMENYDVLIFQVFSAVNESGSSYHYGVSVCPDATSGRIVASIVYSNNYPGTVIRSFWGTWFKLPNGMFTAAAGYRNDSDLFNGSRDRVDSLRFKGNHVYLVEDDVMPTGRAIHLTVLGYNLSGGVKKA